MKLAFLIGYSADKRSARPLTSEAQPFDKALSDFKAMTGSREGPAHFVELWTIQGVKKATKFTTVVSQPKVKGGQSKAALEKQLGEVSAAHAELIKRNEELERLLAETRAPKQQETQPEQPKQPPQGGSDEQPELGSGSLVPQPPEA